MNIFSIVLLLFLLIYLINAYNRLVALRQSSEAAWSDIDVQLKRRANLIPALVETVKGYKKYEAETFEKIVKARQIEVNAHTIKEHEEANDMLSSAIRRIYALAEAYPELKANESFLDLQKQMGQIEEAIQNARRYYNAAVRDYNARLESFPDILIARIFNFSPKEFFEWDASKSSSDRNMPKIDLV